MDQDEIKALLKQGREIQDKLLPLIKKMQGEVRDEEASLLHRMARTVDRVLFKFGDEYEGRFAELREIMREYENKYQVVPSEREAVLEKQLVTITYFKPSGKYYCEDENVEWCKRLVPNSNDERWDPFEKIVRIKYMFAVCMENPLGFPQMWVPEKEHE